MSWDMIPEKDKFTEYGDGDNILKRFVSWKHGGTFCKHTQYHGRKSRNAIHVQEKERLLCVTKPSIPMNVQAIPPYRA